MKNKNWWMILIVLIVVLVAWELWPTEMRVHNFSYDEESSPDLLDACIGESGISTVSWELIYPRKVDLNEDLTVTLSMNPSLSEGVGTIEMCSPITIAANLEIPGSMIEPGEFIFTAFEAIQPTQISWRVIEHALELDGKLWIYALLGDARDLEKQNPLFVIPINIEVKSFFGLDPRLLRIFGLIGSFLIFSLFALVHQHRRE
jgi:hypothetical protein